MLIFLRKRLRLNVTCAPRVRYRPRSTWCVENRNSTAKAVRLHERSNAWTKPCLNWIRRSVLLTLYSRALADTKNLERLLETRFHPCFPRLDDGCHGVWVGYRLRRRALYRGLES